MTLNHEQNEHIKEPNIRNCVGSTFYAVLSARYRPFMPNSCARELNVRKRQGIGRGLGSSPNRNDLLHCN